MMQYIRVDKREKEVSVTIARCKPNHERTDKSIVVASKKRKTRGDFFSKHPSFLLRLRFYSPESVNFR
jgi:ApbE superfamily uncharacterized protein (UPF0280 family)